MGKRFWDMGKIGSVNGFEIKMNLLKGGEHKPPHVHVQQGGRYGKIGLDGSVINGNLNSKEISDIKNWISQNNARLQQMWIEQKTELIRNNSRKKEDPKATTRTNKNNKTLPKNKNNKVKKRHKDAYLLLELVCVIKNFLKLLSHSKISNLG